MMATVSGIVNARPGAVAPWADPPRRSLESLDVVEVVRHVDDGRIAAGEEIELETERRLVVKKPVPQVARNELREHDNDRTGRIAAVDRVQVLAERTGDRAIRGDDDLE